MSEFPAGDTARARLLDQRALHASSVGANNAMNRDRRLTGVNSYARVLGFDPVGHLTGPDPAWLDLCCGSGRALLQAAGRLRGAATLIGVDLVDAFAGAADGVTFVAAPLEDWAPDRAFDLITCVHGLHYVGDKLGMLVRVARWLAPGGRFVADLDLGGVRLADGRPAGRRLVGRLRQAGFDYDGRRRRISCTGPRKWEIPGEYLGADDRAGANYTGQPAVDSYYRFAGRGPTGINVSTG
ncbi:ubiquinone/menaquinone biosynthesis methyltransferase ubiE [Actinoplanes sp. SE50]|uniref:class I SAM-dependent methyltransferase n=1 Tax=unclassified Actinoplanes TaxID=2626549 RepID=UPI00023ED0AD|nr:MULTISPECIES: class I SAM-dependent methyltransferase [unclassified Actinoplanes]AEV85530.1 Ubiquinone/menaquinone biosynthesis methyltransferase ubiE [Actinoplanes sp. SE50/110]ATO83923.1 ubiquinone/menaquinone biosynthesis methyltransferase ubiE [Actinoplanes sp. SE50]SLM01333.1 ubiquinone/menaquinone biosynthesis methyltransferase ubiE [Actinoplanes sp. SE50/110]